MFLNLIIPKKPRRQFLPLSLSEWDLYCRNKRKLIKINQKRSKSFEINLFNEEENQKNYQNIKFRNRAITTNLLTEKQKRKNNFLCVEDRISISSSTCSAPSFTPFQYHNTIAQRIAKRSKSLVKLFNSLKCQRKSSNNEKNFLNKLEKRKSLQIN
ncbi:hypothetical protein ACQ4LE_008327, partial [Meloidogyne hapla]